MIAAFAAGFWGVKQRREISADLENCTEQLQSHKRIIDEQQRRKETILEQTPPALDRCVSRLEDLEMEVPETGETASSAIEQLTDRYDEINGEGSTDTLVSRVSEARSRVSELKGRRAGIDSDISERRKRLTRALDEVGLPDVEAVQDRIEHLQEVEANEETEIQKKWGAIAESLQRFDLLQETATALQDVATRVGSIENKIADMQSRIEERSKLNRRKQEWQRRITKEQTKIEKQQKMMEELVEEIGAPVVVPKVDEASQILADVEKELRKVDEDELSRRRQIVQRAVAEAEAAISQAKSTIDAQYAEIKSNLEDLGLPIPDQITPETIVSEEALFSQLSASDEGDLKAQRYDVFGSIRSLKDEIGRLEEKLDVRHQDLDEASCWDEVETLERRKAVCGKAQPIVTGVRERMLSSVLPGTIAYMELILPTLTAGRYHQADLDASTYKIQVWDSRAGDQGEFVKKNFFSGGTQDQFSLALRLGFALAALPQELGTSPGFLFLDEPLSAFDRQRTDALIRLLTEGEIADRFAQIILIAHDRTFFRNPFPYYVRLEDGQIVEQNLSS